MSSGRGARRGKAAQVVMVALMGDASQYLNVLRQIERNTRRTANNVMTSARMIVGAISGIGTAGLGTVATLFGVSISIESIFQTIRDSVSLAAEFEKNRVAFGTMAGDMEKGAALATDLVKLAAETPLMSADVFQASKLLMNYGVEIDNIIPLLRRLGDVTHGDNLRLQRMALAFGQVVSAGRLLGTEARQMAEAGFNPLQEIARTTARQGQTLTDRMAELRGEMRVGRVTVKMVADAFTTATAEGGRFHNAMLAQSQTFHGLMSTLKDEVQITMGAIGQEIIDGLDLKGLTRELIRFTRYVATWVRSIKFGEFLAEFRTAAVNFWNWTQPIRDALGSLFGTVWTEGVKTFNRDMTTLRGHFKGWGLDWKVIQDFIVDFILLSEFAFTNFNQMVLWAMTGAQMHVTTFWEDFKFQTFGYAQQVLKPVIHSMIVLWKYLFDVVSQYIHVIGIVLSTTFHESMKVAGQLIDDLINHPQRLLDTNRTDMLINESIARTQRKIEGALKGMKRIEAPDLGLDAVWKALLDPREITKREKELREEFNKLSMGLIMSFEDFKKMKKRQWEQARNAPPGLDFRDEDVLNLGDAISKPIQKAKEEMKSLDQTLRYSSEGLRRIQAANIARQTLSDQDRQSMLAARRSYVAGGATKLGSPALGGVAGGGVAAVSRAVDRQQLAVLQQIRDLLKVKGLRQDSPTAAILGNLGLGIP